MADLNSHEPGNSDPVSNPSASGVKVSGREAAQGRMGLQMIIVLGVSIVLVVVVFAAIFGLHAGPFSKKPAGGSGQQGADTHAQAQLFNTSADSPKQNPPPEAVAASRGS